MPKPGTIYRIRWQAFHETEDIQCYADISDNDNLIDDGDDAEVILLQGSDEPCTPSVIDNSEDPFNPVLAQQLTLRFESTSDVNLSTFITGSDQRWGVHYYIGANTKTVFKGFVSIDDISEAVLDQPNTVILTCNDGLGTLREIPLTNFADETPTGLNQLIKYLAWALSKTGLDLELRIANNIKMGSGTFSTTQNVNFEADTDRITVVGEAFNQFGHLFYPGQTITISGTTSNNGTFTVLSVSGSSLTTFIDVAQSLTDENNGSVTFTDENSALHFYEAVSLDAKTFEDEIGTCENCRTVLEKILKENCRLFQMKGQWWIVRVDEIEGTRGLYVTSFDDAGDFIENLGEISFDKTIGRGLDIVLSQERSISLASRPNKLVRLNYRYQYPSELPCNVNFERGDVIDASNPLDQKYEVACWEKLWSNTSTDDPQTTGIYIRRIFSSVDYETQRYVVLDANNTRFTFIMSEAIYVGRRDKFSIGLNRRLSSDVGGSGEYTCFCVQVRLYGNDGTFWTHKFSQPLDDEKVWVECDSTFRTNQQWAVFAGNASEDLTEAKALFSGEAAEIPVDGYIKILLYRDDQFGDTLDTYYEDFSFSYNPYINGSYRLYSGQYHKTNQTGAYNAKREEEIYMGEPPRALMKGAMFISDSDYILANKFYNGAVFPAGPPTYEYTHRYGEIQLFDVWNQVRDSMTVVQGTMQGLDLDLEDADNLPDTAHLVNKYFLTDPNAVLANRMFILLSFNQNHDNQEWNGVFREVDRTTRTKNYLNMEFKYEYDA